MSDQKQYPARLKFYKNKAVLSIGVISPKVLESGEIKAGSVLLELAPSSGDDKYLWDQSITFALSPIEVGTIIGSTEFSLIHNADVGKENNDRSKEKVLSFNLNDRGTGSHSQTYGFLRITKSLNKESVVIALNGGEYSTFIEVLRGVLVHITGLIL